MVQEARALALDEVDLHLVHGPRRRTAALPLPLQQQGLPDRAHERRGPARRPRRGLPVGEPGVVPEPPPPAKCTTSNAGRPESAWSASQAWGS